MKSNDVDFIIDQIKNLQNVITVSTKKKKLSIRTVGKIFTRDKTEGDKVNKKKY